MTVGYGLGMFAYSMGCLFIGAIITYYVLNRPSQQDRENEEYLKELKRKL